MVKKKKRKATKKQLKALAKGRAKRARNLKNKQKKARTKVVTKKRKPMAKRRRTNYGNTLTGGTADVNPQFYHGKVTQSGNDTTTSTAFIVPVPRFGTTANKSVVVEILKVFSEMTLFDVVGAAAETVKTMSWYMSTKFHDDTPIYAESADVFCWDLETSFGAFTALGIFFNCFKIF